MTTQVEQGRRATPAGSAADTKAASRSPMSMVLDQPFNLGLFLPIFKGGWTMSAAPRATDWTFDYNCRLTQRAEALGFDLVFAFAQWLPKGGMGGEIKFRDQSLDSFMAVSALSTMTKRILLITTLHVLYGIHPLFIAKFGATLDHITGGRWGINCVTGSRPEERPMFGLPPIEHDLRYEMLVEYCEILRRLWTVDENLNFDGRFWKLEGAHVVPRPRFHHPVMVNAGNSLPSIKFAIEYSDFIFITSPGGAEINAALESLPSVTKTIAELGAARGRVVRPIINPMIICRDTEKEAVAAYNSILEQGDAKATEVFMRKGDAQSWRNHTHQQRFVGGNVQLIGTPEQVVERMVQLKAAGCGGVQICFVDFEPELEYFAERILPLMYQAGLRIPVHSEASAAGLRGAKAAVG